MPKAPVNNSVAIQQEQLKLQQKQVDLQIQNNSFLQKAFETTAPLVHKYFESKIHHVEAPKIKWSVVGFIAILVIVIGISGFLVYANKLDASNFTFLLGTLIGAVVTFLGDLLLTE